MSISYFVRYDVTAPDLPHFLDYYRRHHVPILARWPGIRSVVLHPASSEIWRSIRAILAPMIATYTRISATNTT